MSEKSIYNSPAGKQILLDLYDRHINNLNIQYEEKFVQTRYGNTHMIIAGNKDSIPLICLHGGNSNTPDTLKSDLPLIERFRIHSIDIIGHPGKSAETQLSSKDLSYGYWLFDVIEALNFKKVNIYAGSFGAGVAIRLATIAPEKINKLFLAVPSGIAKGSIKDQSKLMIPYLRYRIRPNDRNLVKMTSLLMTRFDEDRMELLQAIFKHVKIKTEMPRPAKKEELNSLTSPTVVLAAKNDILFPAAKVIPRAKEIFPNLVYTEILDGLHEPTHDEYIFLHQKATKFFLE
ncbi:MAG: alpha/beta fold hydrolase [Candidatus Hodarchaeales archaeon]|jgi:pimeloyl-ACP methyl ester carboxylesterase